MAIDGTYFGTTGTVNAFCLVVFRDEENKEDVWWKFYEVETYEVYTEGKDFLISLRYVIKGVTADGLPLIRTVFKDIPFQMCLVHMERIITRGTTKFPLLEAGKVLLAIATTFNSLYALFPFLFTYEYDHRISKTTNSIEGHFHHIDVRASVHHGLSLQRKQKLITAILLNSSVTLKGGLDLKS